MRQISISILLTFFFLHTSMAQTSPIDTLSTIDSTDVISSTQESTWSPNPKKSLWFSLIIPGAGQIYNRSYWKAPLVYGGLGAGIYAISFTNNRYKFYREEYILRYNNDPAATTQDLFPNPETVRRIRDIYYKRYQWSIIGTSAVYLLSAIEAYVDAHLKNFEISEDLSFSYFTPNSSNITAFGVLSPTIPLWGIRYTLH